MSDARANTFYEGGPTVTISHTLTRGPGRGARVTSTISAATQIQAIFQLLKMPKIESYGFEPITHAFNNDELMPCHPDGSYDHGRPHASR